MSTIERVRTALDDLVEQGTIPGWVAGVEVDGQRKVAWGGWADPEANRLMERDTPMAIASLSKPVAAVLVLQLVRDGVLGLDDPISRWLPEFAEPRVLRSLEAPLDDTVAAVRPITVRHLLTMTSGIGLGFGGSSVWDEMVRREIIPFLPGGGGPTPDERMASLAALPLQAQPGEGWFYHFSTEMLSVMLTRATGVGLDTLVTARVAERLGLGVLAFHDPTGRAARSHTGSGESRRAGDVDALTRPARFCSLGGGLVSTVDDYLTLLSALAHDDPRLGDPELLRELRSPQISPDLAASAGGFLEAGHSYGYQVSVAVDDVARRGSRGRFGWSGGSGVQAYADPAQHLAGVVFTNRTMDSASGHPAFTAFWDAVYLD